MMTNETNTTAPESAGASYLARSTRVHPLRTWPALVLVALIFATRFAPYVLEGGMSSHWMIAVFGPMICCLLILIWWLAVSRATWKERVFGALGLIAALALCVALADPSMRGPGTTTLALPMGM